MVSGLYCEVLTDWCSFPSGEPVPDYKPPFETELGELITNEAMQEFVARQKRRPGFPDVWKHNHPVSAFKVNRMEASVSLWAGHQANRPFLYSHSRTGTSLQLRLMWGVFLNANNIK